MQTTLAMYFCCYFMLTSAVVMAWPRLHATAACKYFQLHNHEHAIVCTGKAIESSMHKEWFMPSRPSLSCIKLIFLSNDGGMYVHLLTCIPYYCMRD